MQRTGVKNVKVEVFPYIATRDNREKMSVNSDKGIHLPGKYDLSFFTPWGVLVAL